MIAKKDPKEIKKLHKKISQVTALHVKQFAKKIFVKSNMYLVINGPNQITHENLDHLISQI